ncbi:MAG: M20 family metallopeptidase [Candidatus Omnitrophica bacterium]|nr:M20 family metallopeptidase [Candidatus Omnitrophota bacterium]
MKIATVKLLQKLIRIDSYNPPGNEKQIINFIADYLDDLNIKYDLYEFKKNRPNLVCRLDSLNSKKKLLFTPHVDVVPALGKWKYPPLSAKVVNGKIYGRGATDCKVNVAACLALINRLVQGGQLKSLDILFAFCVDEETGSHYGTIPLMKKLKNIDFGVVLDADDFNVIIAQKGMLHLKVELFGKASHGAFPELGINAIEKAASIINDFKAFDFACRRHKLLRLPTISVGTFRGGDKVNIVADYACFEVDIRYLPGMAKKEIIDCLKKIIQKQTIKYKISVLADQLPIEINRDSFLIKALKPVLKKRKIPLKLRPSFGATVLNYLSDQGIESFSFGFGSIGQAHTVNENVSVENVCLSGDLLFEYVKMIDSKLMI